MATFSETLDQKLLWDAGSVVGTSFSVLVVVATGDADCSLDCTVPASDVGTAVVIESAEPSGSADANVVFISAYSGAGVVSEEPATKAG